MIRNVEDGEKNKFIQLTTIATFLSGVTVSTLQIQTSVSARGPQDALDVAVNALLFSSLIFSTASAVQSMVVVVWLNSFM